MKKEIFVLFDSMGDPIRFLKLTRNEFNVINDILIDIGTDAELCDIDDIDFLEIKEENKNE